MSGAPVEQEPLWKVADVVAFLGFKKSWVYDRVKRGKLPYLRIGDTVRFEPAAIRDWVAQHRRGPKNG